MGFEMVIFVNQRQMRSVAFRQCRIHTAGIPGFSSDHRPAVTEIREHVDVEIGVPAQAV
jgi:hypothetical protein